MAAAASRLGPRQADSKVPYPTYKYSTSCLQPERQPARELETQDSSGPLWMSRGRDGYGFCFRYFHEKESTGLRYNYDV